MQCKLSLETLEGRDCPSVTLCGQTLQIVNDGDGCYATVNQQGNQVQVIDQEFTDSGIVEHDYAFDAARVNFVCFTGGAHVNVFRNNTALDCYAVGGSDDVEYGGIENDLYGGSGHNVLVGGNASLNYLYGRGSYNEMYAGGIYNVFVSTGFTGYGNFQPDPNGSSVMHVGGGYEVLNYFGVTDRDQIVF